MKGSKQSLAGIIAILGVAALWGGTFTAMKSAFSSADPMPFLFVRFIFSLVSLAIILKLMGRRPRFSSMGILAGILVFFGYALQMEGLTGISAAKSAFITGLNAPMVPLLEFIIFRRKPTHNSLLAMLVGVLGLSLLTGAIHGIPLSRGDLLTLLCALAWALQIVIVDRAVKGLDPLDLTINQAVPTLVLSGMAIPIMNEWDIPLNITVLSAALYTGILATTAAFFLQAWAQERIPPESAALGLMGEPMFAYLFSWLLLGEILTPIQVLGALLILASIPLATKDSVR